MLVKPRAFYW